MPEYIRDCEQHSERWFSLRLGSVGGSGITKVLAKGKGKTRKSYLYELAAEILTGQKTESYVSKSMERGNELEAEARQYYEFLTGNNVDQIALIKADIPGVHNSPDGLVGDDGGIEIKVRETHTHIELIDTEKISISWQRQCQQFLWVSNRKWVDFVSYCPEIQEQPIWIKRQTPDPKIQAEIKLELPIFLNELDNLVNKIKQ